MGSELIGVVLIHSAFVYFLETIDLYGFLRLGSLRSKDMYILILDSVFK